MTLPFYPFYWGDYNAKTMGLTRGQHGAYVLLLMYMYCTEDRIPDKIKYDLAKAQLPEDRLDVDYILAKYFHKKNGCWFNSRAEEIIKEQNELHETRVNNGKKGGRPSKAEVKPGLSQTKAEAKQPEPEPIKVRKKEPTVLSKEKRGTRLPDNFEPDFSCHQLAETLLLTNQESQDALDNFMDYWRAVPGAKGLKLDWQMTFKNQLRHVAKQKAKSNGKTNTNTIKGGFDVIDIAVRQLRQREFSVRNGDSETDTQDVPRLRQINS